MRRMMNPRFNLPLAEDIWNAGHGHYQVPEAQQYASTTGPEDDALCPIQTLVLDTIGPVTRVLKLHQSGRFTLDAVFEAVSCALRFLWNDHSNISSERWTSIRISCSVPEWLKLINAQQISAVLCSHTLIVD